MNIRAIIPSAGKGTRLHTGEDLPKVMHRIGGRPLLEIVLEQVDFVGAENTYIVVGYKKECILERFGEPYHYIEQKEQLGTGHAVMVCADAFADFDGLVLVTFGDMPLFRREAMRKMCEWHVRTDAACTLMTAENPQLEMWARIVRDGSGCFQAIVEGKDCTPEQKKIRELFAGVLVFDSRKLFEILPEIGKNNVQGEYYLTEVPEKMVRNGLKVETWMTDDGDDLRGVNTVEDMRICEEIYLRRREKADSRG